MYLVVKAKFILGVHCLLVNILGFFFVLVCLCVIFRMGTIEILEAIPYEYYWSFPQFINGYFACDLEP